MKCKHPKKTSAMRYNEGAVITEAGNSVLNKTGSWRIFKPVRNSRLCTRCSFCWMFCPDMAVNEKFEIDYDHCKGCGICAKACPFGAITMELEKK